MLLFYEFTLLWHSKHAYLIRERKREIERIKIPIFYLLHLYLLTVSI